MEGEEVACTQDVRRSEEEIETERQRPRYIFKCSSSAKAGTPKNFIKGPLLLCQPRMTARYAECKDSLCIRA